MSNLNGANITYNGAIPAAGPMALRTLIELNDNEVTVDLRQLATTGKITGIQTLYIDLSEFNDDVIITMPDTQQIIKAKKNTQGYYPVLSTNLIVFKIKSESNGNVPIHFINFPIALGVWGINEINGKNGTDGKNGSQVINSEADGIAISDIELINDVPEVTLKKLIAGDNINIEVTPDNQLLISGTGGGGGSNINVYNSIFGGTPIAQIQQIENTTDVALKKLVAGNNITIEETENQQIVINATGGGGGGGGDVLPILFSGGLQFSAPMNSSDFISFIGSFIQTIDINYFDVNANGIYFKEPGVYNVSVNIQYFGDQAKSGNTFFNARYKENITVQEAKTLFPNFNSQLFSFNLISFPENNISLDTLGFNIYNDANDLINCFMQCNIIKVANLPTGPQ